MKRFLKRIKEKAADNSAAPVLIVAFGDSVTQGWMEYGQLDARAVYHHQLQRLLEQRFPCTTFSVINAGNGGENAPGGLKRLDRDVLHHSPDLVLIAYGLNDAGGGFDGVPAFVSTLTSMVTQIRNRTEADIVLLTPNMMLTRDNSAIPERYQSIAPNLMRTQRNGFLRAYAQGIRDVGTSQGVPVADVYAAWEQSATSGEDVTAWLANGLNHPTREKHQLTAQIVFDCLIPTKLTTRLATKCGI